MRNFILHLALAISLGACQDVIEIDLNTTAPKLVIEANLNDQGEPATVKLSRSVNFSDTNTYPTVKNATVVLADNVGNSEILTQTSEGLYQTKKLQGVIGRTYALSVLVDDKTYTAVSTIPKPVLLRNIRFIEQAKFPGSDTNKETTYLAIPEYSDPVNEQNNYRFVQYANGLKDQNILVRNDNINNGIDNQQPLFSGSPGNEDFNIVKGTNVTIEMLCIDRNVYDYFFALSGGNGGGAAPSNPTSNIKGGALGYFSAHSSQKRTVTL